MADIPGNSEMIILNVGETNKPYRTTRETLEKSSKFREDILQEGITEYFLDRDHELFAFIIRYLRHGTIQFPEGFIQSKALKKEAEYFNLENLSKALDNGAGTKQVIKVIVQPEEQIVGYQPDRPIYDVTPIGWTWHDLEKIMPPVTDATIQTASIKLSKYNRFIFSFRGDGYVSKAPSVKEYISLIIVNMPAGGLKIRVLTPTEKNTILDMLMAKHYFQCIESSTYYDTTGYVEESILCRIKPIEA